MQRRCADPARRQRRKRAGRLRALAPTGGHGIPELPGAPSIGDTALPG
jgi:hypothetical protein